MLVAKQIGHRTDRTKRLPPPQDCQKSQERTLAEGTASKLRNRWDCIGFGEAVRDPVGTH